MQLKVQGFLWLRNAAIILNFLMLNSNEKLRKLLLAKNHIGYELEITPQSQSKTPKT